MRVGKAKRERRQRRLARRKNIGYMRRFMADEGTSLADRFLRDLYPDAFVEWGHRTINHMGSVLQRHGLAKPWCCAFHAGGGNPHAYCEGIGQLRIEAVDPADAPKARQLEHHLRNVVFDEMDQYQNDREGRMVRHFLGEEPWPGMCPALPIEECRPSMDDDGICASCGGPMPEEPLSAAEKLPRERLGCGCVPIVDRHGDGTGAFQYVCPAHRHG